MMRLSKKTSLIALFLSVLIIAEVHGGDNMIKPFPILSWVPPSLSKVQIQLYAEAGFTVMTIWPKEEYYREAKKYWDGNFILFKEWNPVLSLDDMLGFHPEDRRIVGYLIGDEPDIAKLTEYRKVFKRFRSAHPDKFCFVNLFPQYVGETRLGGSYLSYVEKYFEFLKPRYCSLDNYPCFWFNIDRTDFYHDIEILRYYAIKNNSRQIGFVQVYSSNVCREVSESDIAWQVNSFLAYGCKGLWYFYYRHPAAGIEAPVKENKKLDYIFDFSNKPGKQTKPYKPICVFGSGVLDANDETDYTYPFVKRINKEVLVWGPILSQLKSVAVRHASGTPAAGYSPYAPVGTEPFHSGTEKYIASISVPNDSKGAGEFIISYFEDSKKQPYVMIVNKKHGENLSCEDTSVTAEIVFKDEVTVVFEISNKNAAESEVALNNKIFTRKISGGSAILLRIECSENKKQ
jgi:hypothetical protein